MKKQWNSFTHRSESTAGDHFNLFLLMLTLVAGMLPTFHIYMIWCHGYYSYYYFFFIRWCLKARRLFLGAGCENVNHGTLRLRLRLRLSSVAQQPPGTTPSSLKALVCPLGLGGAEAFLSARFSTAVARRGGDRTLENFSWRKKK